MILSVLSAILAVSFFEMLFIRFDSFELAPNDERFG